MEDLRILLLEMKEENKQNFGRLTNQIESLRSEFTTLKTDVTELSYSVDSIDNDVRVLRDDTVPNLRDQLKQEIQKLTQSRISAELYSKKSNLLFYGIKERADEDTESVLRSFLKDTLRFDGADRVSFANVHRLPTKLTQKDRPKPIIAKFLQMRDRNTILDSARILKNADQKYGISPHLPPEMQKTRSMLLTIKRRAIAEGKRAIIKTTGIDVKLYIDNRLWTP